MGWKEVAAAESSRQFLIVYIIYVLLKMKRVFLCIFFLFCFFLLSDVVVYQFKSLFLLLQLGNSRRFYQSSSFKNVLLLSFYLDR